MTDDLRERLTMLLDSACHHCGAAPEPDGDHSCPCPRSNDECTEHAVRPVMPDGLRALLAPAPASETAREVHPRYWAQLLAEHFPSTARDAPLVNCECGWSQAFDQTGADWPDHVAQVLERSIAHDSPAPTPPPTARLTAKEVEALDDPPTIIEAVLHAAYRDEDAAPTPTTTVQADRDAGHGPECVFPDDECWCAVSLWEHRAALAARQSDQGGS